MSQIELSFPYRNQLHALKRQPNPVHVASFTIFRPVQLSIGLDVNGYLRRPPLDDLD